MDSKTLLERIDIEAMKLIRERLTSEPLTGEQIGLYITGVIDMQMIAEHLVRKMDSDTTINYKSINDQITNPVLSRMPETHIELL